MESIAKVRRDYFVGKKKIKQIARERHISKNTVRKIIRSEATAFEYQRTSPQPKFGGHEEQLKAWLESDAVVTSRAISVLSFRPFSGEPERFIPR